MEKKIKISKEDAKKAMLKMLETKRVVLSYAKGEISQEELTKKGIKLANPLAL
ncbi:MAG: hypothetical protein WCY89_08825 [Flavobacteriaceae bacterium]